ncbi:hypothetical protein Taro_016505 [Colocasia esculenta]|uniref:Uncharacterized protein n=1 Tax=Colocasia esculenta TaxID=4460 RepID=A0A843UKI9_COLES|nr:hypothetical protein [Colocasia esculenta]
MADRYVMGTPQPDLDPEAWVDAAGELRKGRVYGFGDSLDTTPVLSSYASSVAPLAYASSSAATPDSGGEDIRTLIWEELSQQLPLHLGAMIDGSCWKQLELLQLWCVVCEAELWRFELGQVRVKLGRSWRWGVCRLGHEELGHARAASMMGCAAGPSWEVSARPDLGHMRGGGGALLKLVAAMRSS